MAVTQLHRASSATNSDDADGLGPITRQLIEWSPDGLSTPFGGSCGRDAASGILSKALAMNICLSASFGDLGADGQDKSDVYPLHRQEGLEGLGSLIALAKLLVDND